MNDVLKGGLMGTDLEIWSAGRKTAESKLSRRQLLALLGGGALASLQASCSPGSTTDSTPGPSGDVVGEALHYASLRELARTIESKQISPVELTQMMLDRVFAVDGRLKSYATVMADRARAAARRAEQEVAAGKYRGPLHGVPIAVKDLCYTEGVRTMGGLAVLADFVPDHDATVVSKLEEASAIILGKLNLTEGAYLGYHPDFDIPVNPWGGELWAGASSSGSGVATAAGLCFASLGTDTGGSVRFPAMANGIVGLKPTYGRVSRYGVLPLSESLDHVGAMARRTGAAAVVFEAIAGFDPHDSTSLQEPVPRMLEELDRGVDDLRIGFDRKYSTEGVDSSLAASIQGALEQLERLGAQIVEVTMPELPGVLRTIIDFEAHAAHEAHYPSRADEYGAYFRELLVRGARVTDAAYAEASQLRTEFSARFRAVFSSVDAVVTPASGVPFDVSSEVQYAGGAELLQALKVDLSRFTNPANLAGTPTLSLPCGFSESGLPYTIQLWGNRLSEPMLCRIGHAYEEATDLTLPGFCGHQPRRDNAPGGVHGKATTKEVHGGVQEGSGPAVQSGRAQHRPGR